MRGEKLVLGGGLSAFLALWLVGLAPSWCWAQVSDANRPAAISADGVPKIPPALFTRLNEYQNMRSAAFAGWSPTGNGILIQTRFGATTQLHRVYTPGGRREQVTFFQDPCSGRFLPAAQDESLLVMLGTDGNENYQIHRYGPRPQQRKLLTDGSSRNTLGPVSRDGRRMVIQSNRRNGRDSDLFLANCSRNDTPQTLLETKDEFWVPHDFSHSGKMISLSRFVSVNESYPALLDVDTRRLRLLHVPGEAKGSFVGMQFSPDDKYLYLATDIRGEFRELARFDLESQKFEWLSSDIPWDVTDIAVDEKSGAVGFVTNEDGASKLYLWQEGKRKLFELPLGVIGALEFSPDGKQLGFTLGKADRPADVFSINLEDGKLTQWTYSEAGGLDLATLIVPRAIRFPSFDKRQIPAYFYQPAQASKATPAPVLISIHGGPEGQSRPTLSAIAQFYLSDMGIAVIYPNVRGSTGYGKTYLKLDNGKLREDAVKDIGALLEWIKTQPELDSRRVGVMGGSYGGYMALAVSAAYPEQVKVCVDVVGIANFNTFLAKTGPYRQDLRRAEYGDEREPGMREYFTRISPTTNADKILASMLVVHGANDPRVPIAEAQQIAAKIREHGRPTWTVFAENEGHGFERRENRDYLQAVQVMFFEQYLLSR